MTTVVIQNCKSHITFFWKGTRNILSRMSDAQVYLPSAVPIPIPYDQLKEIVEKTKDYALMHGVAMRSKLQFSSDSLNFAPFVLIPSTFPRKEFEKAARIQLILNELMHNVAYNTAFLTESLKDTIKVDNFTGNLFKIFETVQKEGLAQQFSLGLLRSDYMVHSSTIQNVKQVEINTIASSFGGIATQISLLNRYVLQELGYENKLEHCPENDALSGLCTGMIDAWELYQNPDSVILFVIEDKTYNICDQRFHEFEIRRLSPKTRVIRRNLTEIGERATLNDKKELIIDGLLVSVVYFRAGYNPAHYPSQNEWDARLLIERSRAIKCPSIHYHLAGTKKIQQTLAQPGALDQFLQDPVKVEFVKEIFTGLYSLDLNEIGAQAVQMALDDPERFVLKPQREGGGNNVYGLDIRDALNKMKNSPERTAWILMEKIQPPLSKGYLVRPGGPEVPELVDMVSELGIFGVVIGDTHKIYVNKQVGHMLRTKEATANEGGVAAGLGALDSPFLIDI